jgi:energy-coupling factor transport system ATP-binding protein
MAAITVDNVSFVYSPGTPFAVDALDKVSFEIKSGKITGIIGRTGSGKSTLVQMFNGLVKPTSGRILLDGIDIWEGGKKMQGLNFKVGLVMQYPEYQLFEETVRKDIAFGPTNMNLSQEEIDERVAFGVRFCNIDESILDKSPLDLSGGEKRRVAIAGVMAMRPDVLVLDEPAAGLDPIGREEIFEGIRAFQRDTGTTVIIVSHSMEDMAKYCDENVVLYGGKLFASGSREEIFSMEYRLTEIGLSIPEITALVHILKDNGFPIEGEYYTVEEAAAAISEILK